MNYQKIYNQLILNAKSRKKPNCYCEKHHIIPKSMGGSDDSENIATLTAREHFIAHWLLKKIHNNISCIYAFHRMTTPVGNGRSRYTSASFKYAKESMAIFLSKTRSGKNHPLFGLMGNKSPNYGSKRSDETKLKLSATAKKRTGKKNPNSKKIICIDNGQIFDSISCAKKVYKIGNIDYALRTGGTAGGLRFSYVGIEYKSKLKGYASASTNHNSLMVCDDLGNVYQTLKDAGASVNVTGSAVSISIRDSRSCKGRVFSYA